jgi:hypothetical protein
MADIGGILDCAIVSDVALENHFTPVILKIGSQSVVLIRTRNSLVWEIRVSFARIGWDFSIGDICDLKARTPGEFWGIREGSRSSVMTLWMGGKRYKLERDWLVLLLRAREK